MPHALLKFTYFGNLKKILTGIVHQSSKTIKTIYNNQVKKNKKNPENKTKLKKKEIIENKQDKAKQKP